MSHSSPATDQEYYTAAPTPIFKESSIIWGGFEALSFDRLAFAVPIRQNLAGPSWTATEHSLATRSRIDLASRVRRVVADTLSDGVPTLSAVASELGGAWAPNLTATTIRERTLLSGHRGSSSQRARI